ncbi:MAG: hypothetical protein AAGL24_01970 [Pseudomonadota bacterium]
MAGDRTERTFEDTLLERLDRLEDGLSRISASAKPWAGPVSPEPDRTAVIDQRLSVIEMRLLHLAESMPDPHARRGFRILPSPLVLLAVISTGLIAYAVSFGEIQKMHPLPQISAGLEKIERLLR